MIKTLADRLAEALAELMHQRVRKEWGFPDGKKVSNEDLIKEKYRGRWWCGLYSPESDLIKNRHTSSPSN